MAFEFNMHSFDEYKKRVESLRLYFHTVFPQLKLEVLFDDQNIAWFKIYNKHRALFFAVRNGYIELGHKKVAMDTNEGFAEVLDLIALYLNEARPSGDKVRIAVLQEKLNRREA